MRCLYCDKQIEKESFYSLFFEEDKLCLKCRKALSYKRKISYIDDLEIESFYEYDSLFKSLILQYKECHDEALKDVFLYGLKEYIEFKYRKYSLIYMPSSITKLNERGFNHLDLIFKELKLEKSNGLRYEDELIQEGKSKKDREKMINNFIYEGKKLGKVLIVDDVLTTGSSIKGAYLALKPYCSQIKGLVLAVSSEKK